MFIKTIISTLAALGLFVSTFAQTQTQNPYSMIGLGLIEHYGNITNLGMGGTAISLYNKNILNLANPAALSAIDTLTFITEFGLKSNFSNMTTGSGTKSGTSTSLNYFAFGFRGSKRWTSSMGLTPMSSIGYEIIDNTPAPNNINVSRHYVGSGGLNTLYLSNCFDITKNFSAAITANYIFGKLEKTNTLVFTDLAGSLNSQEGIKQQVNGFSFLAGLNYRLFTTESSAYTFGVTASPNLPVKSSESTIRGTTTGDDIHSTDNNTFIDTIDFYENRNTELSWPTMISVGIGKMEVNKYNLCIDYSFGHWKNTNYENVRNSHRISAGYSFTPQWNSPVNYTRRVTYKVGAFFENKNIILDNTGINNFAVTLGVGLPLRRGLYNCDIDFQAGKLGTTANGNIADYYAQINIKIRFKEVWFYKPKYD